MSRVETVLSEKVHIYFKKLQILWACEKLGNLFKKKTNILSITAYSKSESENPVCTLSDT